jgi:hypothetical protein
VFTSSLHRNGSSIVAFVFVDVGMFTEPLPSRERLLWLHYSGFQGSRHSILCFVQTRTEYELDNVARSRPQTDFFHFGFSAEGYIVCYIFLYVIMIYLRMNLTQTV